MKRTIKNKIKKLPDTPGVYIFRGRDGSALYIGKAGSLRKRVTSYFSQKALAARIALMVGQAADIDFIQLKSETEALLLEDRLIKEYQPRYNIELKDDKRYPLLKITVNEPWPRLQIVRLRKDDGARYFGPYTDSAALRRVVKFLRKTFKLRSCTPRVSKPADKQHCLYYHLGECLAPCLRAVSPTEYQDAVNQVTLLLEGRTEELRKRLQSRMRHASRHLNYEKAAKLRDAINDLEKLIGTRVRQEVLRGLVYTPARVEGEVAALGRELSLSRVPVWIEAFDVSNIMGQQGTGAVIVFRNGRPYRSAYKRFRIKTVTFPDDYAMMSEIVGRRYSRVLTERRQLPDLVLIDGGKGQLAAVTRVLAELGLGEMPVIGLAKRFEEIFLPEKKKPLILSNNSPALKLLIRVRDEAHRFAVAYHRRLRRRRIKESILDDIPGIGPKRKIKLLKEFKSIDNLANAGVEEICRVGGVSKKVAREIMRVLK